MSNDDRFTRARAARAGIFALVLAVAVVGVVGRAAAADPKKAEAETHYDQGKAYYRTGAYDLAIQEFLAGYKLDPRAGVLFNIARGYEELKDRTKAIEFYKKYLDQGAQATAAVEARARMAGLERQIKEEDDRKKAEAAERERQQQQQQQQAAANAATAMPPPVATTSTSAGATPPGAPGAALGSPGVAGTVSATATPSDAPEQARTLKLAGLITGGAGVVLAGTGGFFALRGRSLKGEINDEIARTGTWTPELTAKDSDMNSANKIALVSFIAGGAAIAAGAVLYAIGWNKGQEGGATAMLTPVVGPDGSGAVILHGRF